MKNLLLHFECFMQWYHIRRQGVMPYGRLVVVLGRERMVVTGVVRSIVCLLIGMALSAHANDYHDHAVGLTGVIDHQENHATMQLRLGRALLCPTVDHLIKQGDFWYAEGGWRSWTGSMSATLDRFVGANWQGAFTGAVTCYYDTSESDVFPVTMVRAGIYRYPQGGQWKASKKHGVLLCETENPKGCPFQEVFYESRHLKDDKAVLDLLDHIKADSASSGRKNP